MLSQISTWISDLWPLASPSSRYSSRTLNLAIPLWVGAVS